MLFIQMDCSSYNVSRTEGCEHCRPMSRWKECRYSGGAHNGLLLFNFPPSSTGALLKYLEHIDIVLSEYESMISSLGRARLSPIIA